MGKAIVLFTVEKSRFKSVRSSCVKAVRKQIRIDFRFRPKQLSLLLFKDRAKSNISKKAIALKYAFI